MSDPKLDTVLDAMAGQPPPGGSSLDALRAAALAEINAHPHPRRWWVDAALLTGFNLVLTVGMLLLMGTSSSQATTPMMLFTTGALLSVLLTAGLLVAARPGPSRWPLALLVGIGLAALCTLLGASGADGDVPLMAGTGCAMYELKVSLLPMVGALLVLRRFAFSPRRAALAGASVGAVGMLSLHLHCPIGSLGHLAFFHLVPWAVIIGVTLLIRRFTKSWSYAP